MIFKYAKIIRIQRGYFLTILTRNQAKIFSENVWLIHVS